jgi:hypothetical protein
VMVNSFWCVVHISEHLKKNAAKNCAGHLHVSKFIDIDREFAPGEE